jgi:protein phosphatase
VQRWVAEARQQPDTPKVEVYYSLAKMATDTTKEEPDADEDVVNLQAPLDPTPSQSAQRTLSPEAVDWPGAKWLHRFLAQVAGGVPAVIEYSEENGEEVLVLQPPQGKPLWDAWEDGATSLSQRFGWLRQIAELLQELHRHQVIVEAMRPEMFVVTEANQVVLADLSELLPMPVPAGVPMKGDLSTAPELVLAPELVDGRSDLFSFGAMVYALHHGRELTDLDFDAHGVPRSFVSVFPDGHPVLTQVVLKSFTRYVENRFPTSEDKTDATGFAELIRHLNAGERSSASLRLDVAGWSSTGLMRTTNEDAFATFHAAAFGEDRWGDQALVVLADGMGGCNAGEVASSQAISIIRESLSTKPPFHTLIHQDPGRPGETTPEQITTDLQAAIQAANASIHAAAEQGDGAHLGMGCTCEAAFLFKGRLYLGHIGDSRTYLYRMGQIRQITQDQTMVNRMVALGVITADEALQHPRRHELDQALGGSHPVEVQLHTEDLQPGDVLVICSDGLTNHVADRSISEVLRNSPSAESAARRLVNLANALGGSDNVTAVIVRVT